MNATFRSARGAACFYAGSDGKESELTTTCKTTCSAAFTYASRCHLQCLAKFQEGSGKKGGVARCILGCPFHNTGGVSYCMLGCTSLSTANRSYRDGMEIWSREEISFPLLIFQKGGISVAKVK